LHAGVGWLRNKPNTTNADNDVRYALAA